MDPGHDTYFRHLVVDLQNVLRKLDSTSDIPDLSNHTVSLHNLVICVDAVVGESHASTDLDEIVFAAWAAFRLYSIAWCMQLGAVHVIRDVSLIPSIFQMSYGKTVHTRLQSASCADMINTDFQLGTK